MLPRELERLSVLREKAYSLPSGTPLRLVTTGGRCFHGTLCSVDDDALYLRQPEGSTVFMIDELRSMRRLDRPRFPHLAAARRFFVALFATILSLPAADVRQQVIDTPNGAMIRVKTTANQQFRVKLLSVSNEGINVQVVGKDQLSSRNFTFDEIQSIKRLNQPLHPGWIAAIVVGILMAVGAAIGGG